MAYIGNRTCLLIAVVLVSIAISGLATSEETTSHPRKGNGIRARLRDNQNRKSESRLEKRIGASEGKNKTGLLALGDGEAVELEDKDKYYEDEDAEYEYDDAGVEEEDDDKFIESSASGGIVFDHVDFVLLRLKHIAMRTTSNITELLAIQQEEFKVNTDYKQGWATAEKLFNESKGELIFNNTDEDSVVRQVPPEYHIALIAYTLGEPSMYYVFNKDTREVCSGTDIDKYQWKSYFKLLQLAVETLGSRENRWRDDRRFLYRGASGEYKLKEGQVLAFQHFISTSAKLISAENFAGKSLFEFQGFYNGTAMAIWDHSVFDHEREVLFSPVQVFKVDSIHIGTHYTRYVLTKHEISEPCNNQLQQPNSIISVNERIRSSDNWLHEYSSSSKIYGDTSFLITFLVSAMFLNFNY